MTNIMVNSSYFGKQFPDVLSRHMDGKDDYIKRLKASSRVV